MSSIRMLRAAALAVPAAHAELLYGLGGTVITFDNVGVPAGQPNGPVQVGTSEGVFVAVSSEGGPLALGEGPGGAWGLGTNGEWSLGKTFAGAWRRSPAPLQGGVSTAPAPPGHRPRRRA